MWLCVGRDRSLQCSRSSLKSSTLSDVQFCRDHAPSGSTDLPQSDRTPPPPRHDASHNAVTLVRRHSDSSADDSDSISEALDDTTTGRTYLLLMSRAGRNSSQNNILLDALSLLLGQGVEFCRTAGCDNVPGDSGYCIDCWNLETGGNRPLAIGYADKTSLDEEEAGSGEHHEKVGSTELAADEIESQSGEVDDGEPGRQTGDSSKSSSADCTDDARSRGTTKQAQLNAACRGPYCDNAGLAQLRGLCMSCYRTLLAVNFRRRHGPSPDDIGAGLDWKQKWCSYRDQLEWHSIEHVPRPARWCRKIVTIEQRWGATHILPCGLRHGPT